MSDLEKIKTYDIKHEDMHNIITQLKYVQAFLETDEKFNEHISSDDFERLMYAYDMAKYFINFASSEVTNIIEQLETIRVMNIEKYNNQGENDNE